MKKWMLVCPNCSTPNEATKEAVIVECGTVYYRGRCIQCGHELEDHQDYSDWLERLDEAPPENDSSQGRSDPKNDE